jgi:hypothetical protein
MLGSPLPFTIRLLFVPHSSRGHRSGPALKPVARPSRLSHHPRTAKACIQTAEGSFFSAENGDGVAMAKGP